MHSSIFKKGEGTGGPAFSGHMETEDLKFLLKASQTCLEELKVLLNDRQAYLDEKATGPFKLGLFIKQLEGMVDNDYSHNSCLNLCLQHMQQEISSLNCLNENLEELISKPNNLNPRLEDGLKCLEDKDSNHIIQGSFIKKLVGMADNDYSHNSCLNSCLQCMQQEMIFLNRPNENFDSEELKSKPNCLEDKDSNHIIQGFFIRQLGGTADNDYSHNSCLNSCLQRMQQEMSSLNRLNEKFDLEEQKSKPNDLNSRLGDRLNCLEDKDSNRIIQGSFIKHLAGMADNDYSHNSCPNSCLQHMQQEISSLNRLNENFYLEELKSKPNDFNARLKVGLNCLEHEDLNCSIQGSFIMQPVGMADNDYSQNSCLNSCLQCMQKEPNDLNSILEDGLKCLEDKDSNRSIQGSFIKQLVGMVDNDYSHNSFLNSCVQCMQQEPDDFKPKLEDGLKCLGDVYPSYVIQGSTFGSSIKHLVGMADNDYSPNSCLNSCLQCMQQEVSIPNRLNGKFDLEKLKSQIELSFAFLQCKLTEVKDQCDIMLEAKLVELCKSLEELCLKNEQVVEDICRKLSSLNENGNNTQAASSEDESKQYKLQFFIKMWNGSTLCMLENIYNLKVNAIVKLACEKIGVKCHDLYAVLNGKSLDMDQFLSFYELFPNSTIEIRPRLRAGNGETFDYIFNNMTEQDKFHTVMIPAHLRMGGILSSRSCVRFLSGLSTNYIQEVLKCVTREHRAGRSFNGAFTSNDLIFMDGRFVMREGVWTVGFDENTCTNDYKALYNILSSRFLSRPMYLRKLLIYLNTCPLKAESRTEAAIGFLINHPCLQHYTDRMKQIMLLDNIFQRLPNQIKDSLGQELDWYGRYVQGVHEMNCVFNFGVGIKNVHYDQSPASCLHFSNNFMKHCDKQVQPEVYEAAYCASFRDFIPDILEILAKDWHGVDCIVDLICNKHADKRGGLFD